MPQPLDCLRDESALRLEADAHSDDVQNELIGSAPGPSDDKLARRHYLEPLSPPSRPRHEQTGGGGQKRQPAALAAGGLGLTDTGRDKRAAAGMTMTAAARGGAAGSGETWGR